MTPDLRPALIGDADVLAVLHAEGFSPGWSAADLGGWLGRPDAFAILCSDAGRIESFGLALTAGDDAELLTLVTATDTRRRGYARRVLGALDAEAVRRGLGRWILDVAADNSAGLHLYRSLGFRDLQVRKGYYARATVAVDAIVMECASGFGCGQKDVWRP